MYGWRARLGLLIPSSIIATEIDFNRIVPQGVPCNSHRFKFPGSESGEKAVANLKKTEERIDDAAEMLMDIRPSVICMTGTGVSFIGGHGYDRMLIEKMRPRCGGVPVTTTTTAVVNALTALKAKNIAIAMPYFEVVSKTIVQFMKDSGFTVREAKWLDKGRFEIPELDEAEIYRLVRSVDTPETEAIFASCTNLHAVGIIRELEADLKKPVVTSNQASAWECLRLAGINESIRGFGVLLEEY